MWYAKFGEFFQKNCKKISWIYCRIFLIYCKFGLVKLAYKKWDNNTLYLNPLLISINIKAGHIPRHHIYIQKAKKKGGFMQPLGQWEKGSLLESLSALVLCLSIVLHFRSYKCDSCWWPKCEWELTIETNCEKNYYFTWKNYPLGLLLFEQSKAMRALACIWMCFLFKIVCVCDYHSYLHTWPIMVMSQTKNSNNDTHHHVWFPNNQS